MFKQGDTCEIHGVEWHMPWPRTPGVSQEYIGHVLVETAEDGAVWVYWHPLDFQPDRPLDPRRVKAWQTRREKYGNIGHG